jgi:uncharacterized protein (TIGR02996 family)
MALEERFFFEKMRADPSDSARLIYADWLDEIGRVPQAELIRVQCALAQPTLTSNTRVELEQRERYLLDKYESKWAKPLLDKVTGWEFRRGVIDSVSVDAKRFLLLGPELFNLAPIRRVRLLDLQVHIKQVVRSPALREIRDLDLCGNELGDDGLALFAGSPHLERIEALNLGFGEISDTGLQTLARSPAFSGIRTLAINDNPGITSEGLSALAASEYLRDLETLDVSGNALAPTSFRVIMRGDAFQNLHSLVLHGNRLRDQGLIDLVASSLLPRLMKHTPILDLRRNEIGAEGVRALAQSPHFANVEVLQLDHNALGDDGLRALADVWHNTSLQVLSLHDNHISDSGLYALAKSPLMATLRVLDLTGNFVTQESQDRLHDASVQYDWRGLLEIKVDTDLRTRPTRIATADAFIRRLRG